MDWTGIKVKTAPALEPVTLAELKLYMSMTETGFDTMLPCFITACREEVENYTGRTLITTTYQLTFDTFPDVIELARPPVQSITSITYVDTDGVTQTLSSSLYRTDLISLFGRIEPAYGESWPSTRDVTNAITVEFKCGYGDAAVSVPERAKLCIKAMATQMFEFRETTIVGTIVDTNPGYQRMLSSLVVPRCA